MLEKEFIILLKFNSLEEGLVFLENKKLQVAFIASEVIYDYLGEEISLEGEKEIVFPSEIVLDIKPKFLPGDLYIENNILKYFKEA